MRLIAVMQRFFDFNAYHARNVGYSDCLVFAEQSTHADAVG